MSYGSLSRNRIVQALRRLGVLAHEQKVTLEISLYGGAVFMLVYGSRDATKDVDALVLPSEIGKTLVAKVAAELSLPADWLNDDVMQFLAEKEAKLSLPEGDFGEGIRIVIPTAAYLLAMKLRACRPPLVGYGGDYGDIRFLVQIMGIGSAEEAEAIHDKFFPHYALTAEAREVVKGAVQART